MASADQLKALIKSHISRDDSHFYSVAMQVAAHEARQGHGRLAEELLSMLDKGKAKLAADKGGKLVPLSNAAKSRTELGNLLSVSEPDDRIADMVLSNSAEAQLNRLVREQRMMTRIREHGLSPRRKVLLVGPPGTGKTLTASVLAGELGIPLFQVRFDALITKFMGKRPPSSVRFLMRWSISAAFIFSMSSTLSARNGDWQTTSVRSAAC